MLDHYPGDPTLPPLTSCPGGTMSPDTASPTGWVCRIPVGRNDDCGQWPLATDSASPSGYSCMGLMNAAYVPNAVKNAYAIAGGAMATPALKAALQHAASVQSGAMATPALKAAVQYAEQLKAQQQAMLQPQMGPMTPTSLTTTSGVPKWAWGLGAVAVIGGVVLIFRRRRG